jgi:hypothetical protein
MVNHHWRDCRPILLDVSCGGAHAAPPSPAAERNVRRRQMLQTLWTSLADSDREAFHRFYCLRSRDSADLVAVSRLSQILRLELELLED